MTFWDLKLIKLEAGLKESNQKITDHFVSFCFVYEYYLETQKSSSEGRLCKHTESSCLLIYTSPDNWFCQNIPHVMDEET